MGRFQQFISELRRRRVFRALVGWGIVSFAVLQVVEPIMHALNLPDWTLKGVVGLLALGFPIAAALSWAFDIRATGIERTAPPAADPSGATRVPRGARLALLLLAIGAAAAAPGVAWVAWRSARVPSKTTPTSPSIAVLPFADMSPQKDQEYFADGIAEEVLNALAHIDGLRVPGRTSSFWFKGRSAKLEDIGRELKVGAVLEGSVRKDGKRIRVTAQLVNVSDGYHLWSETFDRELTDVFGIQDEISRAVVAALKVKLLAGANARLKGRTTRVDAYDQYLLGRRLLGDESPASIRGAREAFERAVALDPGYAPAHAALAQAWGDSAGHLAENPDEVTRYAEFELAAAERAITLDPDLPDGYVARAGHRVSYRWDWSGALSDLERAKALGSENVGAQGEYAQTLAAVGRMAEAVAVARRATEDDPLSAKAWSTLAILLGNSGNFSEADSAARHCLQVSPDNPVCDFVVGLGLLGRDKPEEALVHFARNPWNWWRLEGLAVAYHRMGQTSKSQAALDELVAGEALNAAYQIAEVHAARGEPDAAFDWLERARTQHDEGLPWVRYDWLFRSLYRDPRWNRFLQEMNLPAR